MGAHLSLIAMGLSLRESKYKVRPDIPDQIRGTEHDPFHQTFVDDAVWARIESLWGTK